MKSVIRITCFAVCIIIVLSFVSGVNPVAAGENKKTDGSCFMGIKYGYHDIDMETDFTRQTSGVVTEISHFENNYSSHGGSLFTGYMVPFERFYLSAQAQVSVYGDEFELSAGSSQFTNTLNYAVGVDLMPGFYLTDSLSAFVIFGLGYGNF
ncbi:MAG: hypothetical protein GY729_12255, partial [Desulfobacteraceae bacterium]|nr:hypothetical protein [Desulfobacteraceae bacterium]